MRHQHRDNEHQAGGDDGEDNGVEVSPSGTCVKGVSMWFFWSGDRVYSLRIHSGYGAGTDGGKHHQ